MVERNLGQLYELSRETEGTFFPVDTEAATNLLNLFPVDLDEDNQQGIVGEEENNFFNVEQQDNKNNLDDVNFFNNMMNNHNQQQEEEEEEVVVEEKVVEEAEEAPQGVDNDMTFIAPTSRQGQQQQQYQNKREEGKGYQVENMAPMTILGNENQNVPVVHHHHQDMVDDVDAWLHVAASHVQQDSSHYRFTPVNAAVSSSQYQQLQQQQQQKKKSSVDKATVGEEDRDWHVYCCERTCVRYPEMVKILVKTRTQPRSSRVPERVYSSLIYDIGIMLPYSALTMPHRGPIRARIQLMNASTNKEAIDRRDNAACLLRNLETELEANGTIFSGPLKVKLNTKADLTYHKTRTRFYWQIQITQASMGIITMRSAAFKVLARKPAETRKALFEDTNERPVKRIRLNNSYQEQVLALADVGRKLNSQDRFKALKLFSDKLGFSFDFLMGRYYQSMSMK